MAAVGTHMTAVLGAIGKGSFTIEAIADHLPMARRDVSEAAARLIARGLIERQERGVFSLSGAGSTFLADGGVFRSGPRGKRGVPNAPRLDTFRQRAWQAMRIKRRFTVGDIAMLAGNATDRAPERNLHRWFAALGAAGFLVERPTRAAGNAPTSNGFKVWSLERDSGVIAPVLRGQDVYDPNTLETVPCQ